MSHRNAILNVKRSPAEIFAAAAEQSRLLSPQGSTAVRTASQAPHADPSAIAGELVAAGELTRFQADKLLAGQWHGLILGPYRILDPLGRGGLGVVYRASSADRPELALKILPPKKADAEPRTCGRFEREMMLGRLVPRHPHLTEVYSVGRAAGVRYIALEYVPGSTLRSLVLENGRLPVPAAAAFFAQIAEGLHAAHVAGLVHRDLKPANVMLTPSGTAKLLDFGFALVLGEQLPADPTILGGPGYAVGTMDYIAPEQAADAAKATPQSDLYSLGCSLYFALAGCPPFPGGSALQKIRWHTREAPPPVRSLNPDIPADVAGLINRLMAKDPADRPPDAAAVAAELRHFAPETVPDLPIAKRATISQHVIELTLDDLWDEEDETAGRPEQDEPTEQGDVPGWLWVGVGLGLCFLSAAMGFFTRYLIR